MEKLELIVRKQLIFKKIKTINLIRELNISRQYFYMAIKYPSYPPNATLVQIARILDIDEDIMRAATHEVWLKRKSPPKQGIIEPSESDIQKTSDFLSLETEEEEELISLVRDNQKLAKTLIALAKVLVSKQESY